MENVTGKKNRRPALIPTPNSLSKIMELVNLLPLSFRKRRLSNDSKPSDEELTIIYSLDRVIRWESAALNISLRRLEDWKKIDELLPAGWELDYTFDMWFSLLKFISHLPFPLQAFILNDNHNEYMESENEPKPKIVGIPLEIQIEMNLDFLHASEATLKEVIRKAEKRVSLSYQRERQKTTTTWWNYYEEVIDGNDKYVLISSEDLAKRARQKLIFVLAANELFMGLTEQDAWMQLRIHKRYCSLSDLTSGDISILQQDIKDAGKELKSGTIRARHPYLYWLFDGIEAARIKQCLVCLKIFWAGRRDAVCCSSPCANVHRQRKMRERQIDYERRRAERERLVAEKAQPHQCDSKPNKAKKEK